MPDSFAALEGQKGPGTASIAHRSRGRPRVAIDWTILDALLRIQCTRREVASVLGCSDDTITRAVKRAHRMTYEEYAASHAAAGHVSIRRRQYELAMSGDRTMLIWLGKQYLGQSEKQETGIHDRTAEQFTRFTFAIGEAAEDALAETEGNTALGSGR